MLYGFTISNFRNFPDEEQWVSPLGRVNIFIGSNNSGKSNILRYVKKVITPTLSAARNKGVQLSEIDRPRRGGALSHVKFLAPFDGQTIIGDGRRWDRNWTEALKIVGVLDETIQWMMLPVSLGPDQRGHRFYGDVPSADRQAQAHFHNMWGALTGSSGGGYEQHWYPQTIDKLISTIIQEIRPHYIPSFRQIPTRMESFSDEYTSAQGETHIIEELAGLAYPSYTEQKKKKQFEKLRKFIGGVIGDMEVQIEIPNDRKTINVRAGADFFPIEALGSGVHEVFMLASEIVLRSGHTILLEEPEVHLHPDLQRRFMRFVMEETEGQFFITTHSSSIIDTMGAKVFSVSNEDGAYVKALITSQDKFDACRELGFKASDILQTNCIIWVEGPSDRIYVSGWLRELAPDLLEGIHYSIMFYGGKLLSHLSADDREIDDFILILPLCRQVGMILDSDFSAPDQTLRATKQRLIKELDQIEGFTWVTAGREIENYYGHREREAAVKSVHPAAKRLSGNGTRYEKPLAFLKVDGVKVESGYDKVSIAKTLLAEAGVPAEHLDFTAKIDELVAFIRGANE